MTRTDNLVTTDTLAHRQVIMGATASIVAAMVSANFIPGGIAETIKAIKEVSIAVGNIGDHAVATPLEMTDGEPAVYTPAVTARKSLANPDVIISMIDGKPYKTLRRHLATHGMTPHQYRERYGLKADYPMVAPTYSDTRRAMAKKIGLGRKPGALETGITKG